MQSKVTPGMICTDESLLGRRDAFHAPCVLVKCAGRVIPGDQVTFASATEVVVAAKGPIQGVADPFYLARFIAPGELFWVFLMPELVSNLRHHFDIAGVPEHHPDVLMGFDWSNDGRNDPEILAQPDCGCGRGGYSG